MFDICTYCTSKILIVLFLTQQGTEEFKWVDGWPLLWTNWGPREPSQLPGEGCVTVTSDGDWDNTNCAIQQVSMCKYTVGGKEYFLLDC